MKEKEEGRKGGGRGEGSGRERKSREGGRIYQK